MAQEDFETLVLGGPSEDSMLDAFPPFTSAAAKSGGDETYVPVNYIPEEVYAMIKKWQLQQKHRSEVSDTNSQTGAASSSDAPIIDNYEPIDYEPLRICPQAGPPKRFYRTFWRSAARRMLECEKAAVLAAKRVSKI